MQKTYCDICKGEIDPEKDGHAFDGESGDVTFTVNASVKEKEGGGDLCLPCTIEAIDKRARAVLGRKYRKTPTRTRTVKPKVETSEAPETEEHVSMHYTENDMENESEPVENEGE
ncbi:MAG: hypothetical protein ACWGQW_00480 [bacterium]